MNALNKMNALSKLFNCIWLLLFYSTCMLRIRGCGLSTVH